MDKQITTEQMKNPSGTKDDSMKITESKVYTSACGIKLAEIDLAFMITHNICGHIAHHSDYFLQNSDRMMLALDF